MKKTSVRRTLVLVKARKFCNNPYADYNTTCFKNQEEINGFIPF